MRLCFHFKNVCENRGFLTYQQLLRPGFPQLDACYPWKPNQDVSGASTCYVRQDIQTNKCKWRFLTCSKWLTICSICIHHTTADFCVVIFYHMFRTSGFSMKEYCWPFDAYVFGLSHTTSSLLVRPLWLCWHVLLGICSICQFRKNSLGHAVLDRVSRLWK